MKKSPSSKAQQTARNREAEDQALRTAAHEKVRQQRKKRQRRTILSLLALFLIAECAAFPFTSPHFRVRQVTVSGAQGLLEEESKALDTMLALPKRTNWFLAPLGDLEKRARALPAVREARARHRYWDGVAITISPRETAATLNVSGVEYEIDSNAVPIRLVRPQLTGTLPLVELDVEQGPVVELGKPVTDLDTLGVLTTLKEIAQIRGIAIKKIRIDRDNNMWLNMRDGLEICLGDALNEIPRLKAQANFIATLYQRKPLIAQELKSVDLTVLENPVCVTQGATPSEPSPEKTSQETTG